MIGAKRASVFQIYLHNDVVSLRWFSCYLSHAEESISNIGVVQGGDKVLQVLDVLAEASNKVHVDLLHIGIQENILHENNKVHEKGEP